MGAGRLAYLEGGGPGPGRTVVFLHGFGGDHANWALVQGTVAAAGHRTLAIDLPGHGASTKEVGDGSADAIASRLAEGLSALGGGPVAVVAHSFAALVAAALVRRTPGSIGPVILIAPVGLGPAPDPAYIRGYLAAERKRDMKPVLERLFADPAALGRGIVGEALDRLRDEPSRAALEKVGAALLALSPEGLAGARSLLASGAHVVWGDRDAIVPLPDLLAQELGGALHRVPQAGHMPHIEQPGVVRRLLIQWLA